MMKTIQLSSKKSSTLWQGDAVVLGAGLAALACARTMSSRGVQVCLLSPEPTLGSEISQQWRPLLPDVELIALIRDTIDRQAETEAEGLDIVLGTIACDLLAEEAGVQTFFRTCPCRPLVEADGRLAGVEVVGKSGRQAVLASTVIDATSQRIFSRSHLRLPIQSPAAVSRVGYIQGVELDQPTKSLPVNEAVGAVGNTAALSRAAWNGEVLLTVTVPASLSDPEGPLLARSFEAVVRAVEHLRKDPRYETMSLVDVAPACIPAGLDTSVPADWSALTGTGLYVVPESADLAEELASAEAMTESLSIEPLQTPLAPVGSDGAMSELKTSELTISPEHDLPGYSLPPATAWLHEPVDVVVAGYGTGGCLAALTAAEEGLSVAVLDPAAIPGGIGTAGRIHSYYHGLKGGKQDILDEGMNGLGQAISPAVQGYHPVAKVQVLSRALVDSGQQIQPGHTVFGVVKEGNRISGILSAAADGYHVFPCQTAIDATGDGDVAAAAGAAMTFGRDGDGYPQPYSYTPTLMRNGRLGHHNFDAGWVDPTDTIDLSRAHAEGRKRIWDWGPYNQDRHYCSLASIIGIRESRFLGGSSVITFDDFLEGRTYPDSVCSAMAHHDNHAMDYAEESEWCRRHVVMFGLWRYLCHGDIPFRALLPQDVSGLLMACRALAVDHDLHQLVRMQRDIQVFGEICGLAAAMSVKTGCAPVDIDVAALQEELQRRGIAPHATEAKATGSINELLGELGNEDSNVRGLAMWRLSRLQGADIPDWDACLQRLPDAETRFAAAVAAALGGSSCDAVQAVLRQTIDERVDGPRLGTKSPPRFVVAALALAEIKAEGTAKAIGGILSENNLEAPDVLLLLEALARVDQMEGIGAIKRFLTSTEGDDFSIALWGVRDGFHASFRPVVDIRAVRTLGALGCHDEDERLTPYLNAESLLLRRHARRVAEEVGFR